MDEEMFKQFLKNPLGAEWDNVSIHSFNRAKFRTITDPRVKEAWGGGLCPEQHWGYLRDERPFYLRLRHAVATLQLGCPGQDPEKDLPMVNPQWNREDFEAACEAGEPYPHSFWLDPRPGVVVYPDESWIGSFASDEDLQRTFTMLLDEIEATSSP